MVRDQEESSKRLYSAWISIPCEKCGASVGQMCVTSEGKLIQHAHTYRSRLARWKMLMEDQKKMKSLFKLK